MYHSVYDSLTWVQKFGDPTFAYHTAMTQLWGLLTLRMADAAVLPFNYTELGNAVHSMSLGHGRVKPLTQMRSHHGATHVFLSLMATLPK